MKMYLLFEVVASSVPGMFFYPASLHVLYSHAKLAFLSTICVFGSCFLFVFLFFFHLEVDLPKLLWERKESQ